MYGSYPDIDDLFPKQAAELDRKKREEILHKMQQLVYEKAIFAPIWELAFINGIGPRLGKSSFGRIAGFPYTAPFEDLTIQKALKSTAGVQPQPPRSPEDRALSFDHLVGAGEQRLRHCQAKCFRGLQVDEQLELGRLLNWQIGWLLTLEDPSGINARIGEGAAYVSTP